MESLHEHMKEYKKQLEKGVIQKAYKGLMEYIMGLRTHLSKKYPDYFVSSSIFYGFMDMTYFSFTPKSLQNRKLKIAIVFLYDPFRFEIWLAGANKQVQEKYWELIKESGWNKYHVVPTIQGFDSIIEHIAVDNPDFDDLDTLTGKIESGALRFIDDVERFLSKR